MRWSYLLMKTSLIIHMEFVKSIRTTSQKKKKIKSVIVNFKSWKARQQLYNARPRNQKDDKKNFSISVDLTRRRYQLVREARRIVEDIIAINFALVNINCSLGVRYENDSFHYVSSKQELHNIINKFD